MVFSFVTVVSLLLAPGAAAPTTGDALLTRDVVALRICRQLVDGAYDAVLPALSDEARQVLDAKRLQSVMEPLRANRGPATKTTLIEQSGTAESHRFVIQVSWARGPASRIDVAFTGAKVSQLRVSEDPTRFDDYSPKTTLRAPFKGTWFATNANRNPRNHQRKRGLKPAALWIVPSSKSARCLTFCIRRCWMK